MFKQKIIKNIILVMVLFLLQQSHAVAQYEEIEFATDVTAFDVWGKDRLLLGDASGKLTLFNMRTGLELSCCNRNQSIVSLVKIPGQRRVLVSFANSMVALFRYDGKILKQERIVISSFSKHFVVKTIQISPDGKFAILHPESFTRKSEFSEVWNIEENRMVFKFSKVFNSETSVITSDSNCVIVNDSPGIISWYRLYDGLLFSWIDLNCTFGQQSKKGFIGYNDIINLVFQNNSDVLSITTSAGKILKIGLSGNIKLVHQDTMKLGEMCALDTMVPLQGKEGGDFFIGSHSLFFDNKLFLFNAKNREVITCSTSKSIKTIKIINERLPITLHQDGTLVGWIFDCLPKKKIAYDRDLEQRFGRLGLV